MNETAWPICIVGMHRSGTSMVAKLLYEAGLDLGPQADWIPADDANTEGHFEHAEFVKISDEILEMFNGWWDCPPEFPQNWADDPRLESLLHRGRELIRRFGDRKIWGWKDPRNSLTLPFWRKLLPEMKVVICVRNPLEVALSLRKRNGFSQAMSFRLWKLYNQRLLADAPPSQRIITHYDAYFVHPGAEPRRIIEFTGLPATDEVIDRCSSSALPMLRHNHFTTQHLLDDNVPRDVFEMYVQMCVEAGWLSDDGARHAAQARTAVAALAEASGQGPPAASQTFQARVEPTSEAVLPRVGAWRLDRLELLRAELNASAAKVGSRDARIAELQAAVTARDAKVAELTEKLQQPVAPPPPPPTEPSPSREEIDAITEAKNAAERESAELRLSLAHAQAHVAACESQLKLAEQSMAALNARIDALEQVNSSSRRDVLELVDRVQDAVMRDESAKVKIESLEVSLGDRDEEIAELKSRLELMSSREGELRQMLLDAHDQLIRRDEELRHREAEIVQQGTLLRQIQAGAAVASAAAAPPVASAISAAKANYLETVGRIKEAVAAAIPPKAAVAVVSKGDEELTRLNGRTAWHFPQDDRGGYAGFHPADSADAIARLEAIRKKGAQYLLLPATSFWWMDHYKDFRRHLELRYRKVRDNEPCIVFELSGPAAKKASAKRAKAVKKVVGKHIRRTEKKRRKR